MVPRTGKVNSYNLFIDGLKISCSKDVKVLEITIDNQLKLKNYIRDLCKKASCKPHPLRRLRSYLKFNKTRLLAH